MTFGVVVVARSNVDLCKQRSAHSMLGTCLKGVTLGLGLAPDLGPTSGCKQG